MEEDSNRELQLALEEKQRRKQAEIQLAEQEQQRRRDEAMANRSLPEKAVDTLQNVYEGAGQLAGRFNYGFVSPFLPKKAEDYLYNVGAFGDFSKEPTAIEKGFEYAGMAAPIVVSAPLALERAGYGLLQSRLPQYLNAPIAQSLADDVVRFVQQNPISYAAGEAAASFGAGTAKEIAAQNDVGLLGQFGAELGGAILGGGIASVPSYSNNLLKSFQKHLLPFTDAGARLRAAEQVQKTAGGSDITEQMAVDLESIPEGMTPAQYLGDEGLMRLEGRILEDNPALAKQVAEDLENLRFEMQDDFRGSFGEPPSQLDWEKSIIQSVAPKDAKIEGYQTNEMLDSAYNSFAPLYNEFAGIPAKAPTLDKDFAQIMDDPSIIAPESVRKTVSAFLADQVTAFKRQINKTDDLFFLRNNIRTKRRDLSRTQTDSVDRASIELLKKAENHVTNLINDSLTPKARNDLASIDNQYRKYKIVENAIYRAGDTPLTPSIISDEIRRASSNRSAYARGSDETTEQMRIITNTGRSAEEILGDPRRAALMIRGLDKDGVKSAQANFVNTLFNRAKTSGTQTPEGATLISGKTLQKDIFENIGVMRALKMSDSDIRRLQLISDVVNRASVARPAASAQLFDDAPATLLQLAATLIGAESGGNLASSGIGSGMVMAQFMARRARNILSDMTGNQAEKLLTDAVTDPKLFSALLTGPTTNKKIAANNARYLETWLLANFIEQDDSVGNENNDSN